MNTLRLVKNVRALQRLRRILTVLSQHGFGHLVDRMNLRRFMPLRGRRTNRSEQVEEPRTIGQRLAEVCNELGPTFVKLGQMLTSRPDLVPADILQALKSLQDHVPPFDSDIARKIVEDELGGPVEQLYRSIADEPLASGSIGQVYQAVAADGMDVVVKVKRPGIDDDIRLDLHLVRQLAEALERFVPETRVYRPCMLVDEFEQALTRELDFTFEASNTTRVHAAFVDDPTIQIPKVRWELSSPRVLTLQLIEGRNIERVLGGDAHRFDRKRLASNLANAFVKQFFELGTFHADPHAGNLLVAPPSNLGLIDFGQTGLLSDEMATKLVAIIVAAIERETDLIVSILADLNSVGPETDTRNLSRDLSVLLNKYYGLPLKRLDLMKILDEFTEVMRKHDVSMPRELVLVFKTLGTVTGIVLQLDPEFDLVALFRPQLKKLIRQQLTPNRVARSLAVTGWNLLGLLRETPQQIRGAMRHFAKGQWRLNVHHEHLEDLIHELDRSSNRLSFSVVIGAIIVGSSLVVTAAPDTTIFGVRLQWFGIVGYLVAGILGIALIWAIFRSGRLS